VIVVVMMFATGGRWRRPDLCGRLMPLSRPLCRPRWPPAWGTA